MKEHGVPIWFFIGALLLVYGVLILGAGLYGLAHPPAVALAQLHVGVWWGLLLIAIGALYVRAYRPGRMPKPAGTSAGEPGK
jgi:hypothetical protein